MGDSTKQVAYEVTADASGFTKGMEQASTAATTATAQIDAQFKRLGDSFGAVQKVLVGFVAVLAGGGALKRLIDDANAWNGEAAKMAKQLGLTTEKASVLNVALNHIGVDSATYISASEKLSKNIQGNAQAFQVMGIKVQEALGQYRPMTEVMTEVNEKLAALKNPIEQNIAGQQIYGKGWSEVRAILKLTTAGMAEAESRARELGLIVGPEGAAMSRKYTEQMRDLHLVGRAIEVQFGNALLPIFTQIGGLMAKDLPQAASTFGAGLKVVMQTLLVLGSDVSFVFTQIGKDIAASTEAVIAMQKWQFDGARKLMDARATDAAKARADLDAYQAKVMGLGNAGGGRGFINPPMTQADEASQPHYKFKEKAETTVADKSKSGQWEAELSDRKLAFMEMRNAEGSFQEFSKQSESEFWRQKLALTTTGTSDNLSVRKKVAEIELSMNKDRYATLLESLKVEEAAYKTNIDARLEILNRESALVKDRYGAESKEYLAAQKAIVEARRAATEQLKQIDVIRTQATRQAQLAEVALEEQAAQLQRDIGLLSAQQELAMQQQFEQRRYQISFAGLQDRLAIAQKDPDRNPVELARLHAELEALEQQHQQRMVQIKSAIQKDAFAPLTAIYKGAEAAISASITGILNRTMTLRQGMAAAWKGISQSIIQAISDYLAKQVAAWAIEKAMALYKIGANAATAGSGAAASVADIPYIGPILAIAALASVFGAVSGMKSNVPSAAGGYDIPASVNPLTQLHEKEMVLPARYADVIRQLADSNGAAGGASTQPAIHLHVSAMDGQSVKRMLLDNQDHLATALRTAHRNGAFWSAR